MIIERDLILQEAASKMLEAIGVSNLRRDAHVRTVQYFQPPLIVGEREDKLHLVRRPEIDMDGDEALGAFEAALDILMTGQSAEALSAIVGGPASKMIRRFSRIESQVVALVWYLAGAQGAYFDYSNDSCVVDLNGIERGIHDGKLLSTFRNGEPIQCNPRDVLTKTHELCRSTESVFIMAYNLARQRSEYLAEGMAILYQAVTPQAFKQYVTLRRTMSKAQSRAFESVVMDGKDPVQVLYKRLVPKWMSLTDFTRAFGPLASRDLEPDVMKRSAILNKLAVQPFYRG